MLVIWLRKRDSNGMIISVGWVNWKWRWTLMAVTAQHQSWCTILTRRALRWSNWADVRDPSVWPTTGHSKPQAASDTGGHSRTKAKVTGPFHQQQWHTARCQSMSIARALTLTRKTFDTRLVISSPGRGGRTRVMATSCEYRKMSNSTTHCTSLMTLQSCMQLRDETAS